MPAFFARQSYLGIDIGTSSIKLVELEEGATQPLLRNYVEVKARDVESGPVSNRDDLITAPVEELTQLVGKSMEQAGIKTRRCAFALPIYATFSTIMQMPPLEAGHLEDAVKFEAQKHIPLPLNETILEWRLIEEVGGTLKPSAQPKSNKPSGAYRVFLLAVPSDLVARYKQLSQLLELEVEVLEVEIFSLARLVFGPDAEEFLLIDMGGRNTNITFFGHGLIRKTVNLPHSGDDFSRALMAQGKLSFTQAEAIKMQEGLRNQTVAEILGPTLSSITVKAREFLLDAKPKKVVLAGGAAKMPGFIEYFTRILTLPVEYINPWTRIAQNNLSPALLNDIGPSFAVALGLTIRGVQTRQ